ncbi:BSD domain-containing protein [Abeliophyllum distichum]|uniref:BSD domain-containing protein n=1 Tax=Abeliophyllum distichum TaxID=126358 RepID=A0ABD1PDR6_9LAMI
MDFWQRARSFAVEAGKRSQELTQGISSTNFSDVVSEASKRSKELAAEVSNKSKEIAVEASKKSKEIAAETSKKSKEIADQIKFQIPPVVAAALTNIVDSAQKGNEVDLEKYGVTDELRQFVKGISMNTFQDFPLEDDSEMSDIPTVSNVRQDLTEWQATHAKLMLATVKEISKLRYELCPRVMKERKFWRIYFILVNSHVTPYEKGYMEELKLKSVEKVKEADGTEITSGGTSSKAAVEVSNQKSNNAKSSASEQDLDVFLLGDLEDSDDGPDGGDDGFDDDFDKI